MFRLAVRNITTHRLRLLTTMLAVVLGVAFVAATLIFNATVSKGYQDEATRANAGVDVAVRATPQAQQHGQLSGLTGNVLDKVRALPGVASARGQVSGDTYVINRSGDVVGNASHGANFAPDVDGKDPDHSIADGRAPQQSGEIALDTHTATKTAFHVGDTIRVVVDGSVMTEKLVGLFTTDPAAGKGATFTLFDTATAQRLFGSPGQYTRIAVKAAAGTSDQQLLKEITPVLGRNSEAITGTKLISDERAADASSINTLSNVFLAFAMVSLFVGIFLIANTFTMLVAQRAHELALVRAIGATRRQVVRAVQLEALIVGLISSAIGLVLGVLIASVLHTVLNGLMDAGLPGTDTVVSPGTIAGSLFAGTAVTVLAAWLPGRRASKIPPIAAMNSVNATPTQASLRLRNAMGFMITAIGVGLGARGMAVGSTSGGYLIGAGAGLLNVALVVLTPFLSRPLLGLLNKPFTKWFGIDGKLATENARRNPRRTASTTAALMLGLTLVTAVTVVGTSIGSVLAKQTTGSLRADFTVSTINDRPLDPAVTAKIASVAGVTAASPIRTGAVESVGKVTGYTVTAVDPAEITRLLTLHYTAGNAAHLDSGLLVTEAAAERGHLHAGDSVTVTFADGKQQPLIVSGIIKANPLLSNYLMSLQTLAPHIAEQRDDTILVKATAGHATDVQQRVKTALHNPLVKLQDHRALEKEVTGSVALLLNMIYGLLGMALIISVLSVVNTMSLSVFERTQEIGMLRAIGMRREGIKRMIRLESIVISLFGSVLGVVVGAFTAWALGTVFSHSKLLSGYTMQTPWERILLFLAASAAVGALAALWPARRAAALNTLQAIKTQ
ncbi:ABC transporter permease [Streptomyces mirabilis]|uniref:ABC transporter permease n=1 Tax=Streptomyces mirabilis TaxID=68239 RepID=UPI00224E6782|nr:FtsX-like permease family protein [Streptomyces mirabilis]MCX4429711.1 FtsX-like permease family protein [Streptomyces mirabilis]